MKKKKQNIIRILTQNINGLGKESNTDKSNNGRINRLTIGTAIRLTIGAMIDA